MAKEISHSVRTWESRMKLVGKSKLMKKMK